jgi:hypothetical protein
MPCSITPGLHPRLLIKAVYWLADQVNESYQCFSAVARLISIYELRRTAAVKLQHAKLLWTSIYEADARSIETAR